MSENNDKIKREMVIQGLIKLRSGVRDRISHHIDLVKDPRKPMVEVHQSLNILKGDVLVEMEKIDFMQEMITKI